MSKNSAHNQKVATNVLNWIDTRCRERLGDATGKALKVAMEETKKDSGRAAANWRISVSSAPVSESMNPANYYEQGVQGRGDKVGKIDNIWPPKSSEYGLNDDGTMVEGGYLYTKLKIGNYNKGWFPPPIFLYNPVLNIGPYTKNAHLTWAIMKALDSLKRQ